MGDVDLDHRVAIVIGKGRRPRACPYGAKTASALDRYLHLRARNRFTATSDALWLGKRGPMGTPGHPLAHGASGPARPASVMFTPTCSATSCAHRWLADGGNETDLMRLVGRRTREMLGRSGASAADERARATYQGRAPGDRL